jgi:tetratricopeptide (TPR) repeat protein
MRQEPVTSLEAPIHSLDDLPIHPPERLFGRESDLTSLNISLTVGTPVLLYGPAGIGKTALAAALAGEYLELPGGVLWLDVTNDSLRSLLSRIARAYAAELGTDLSAQIALVRDLLQSEQPLIVLDGHPHLGGTRDFIRLCASGIPLVLTAPNLISGSWTPHEVTPLDERDAQAMLSALTGRPTDATLMQLSKVLGGHPLSIAITARQLSSGKVQPADFLSRLSEPAPGVMDVLMAAYRGLPAALQGMVVLVGTTFAGGASEELLADSSGAPAQMIRSALRQLVTFGFASERSVYGQPYFTTHEAIQAFAQAFLRGKQQLDTMLARHLRGLVTYVGRHAGDNSIDHQQRLAAEIRTILAAGSFAASHNQKDPLQKLTQLLEPAAPDDFVYAQGFQAELDWLRYLIDHPESTGDGLLSLPEPAPEPVIAVEPEPTKAPQQIEEDLEDIPPQEDISTAFIEPIDDITEEDTSRAPITYDFLEEGQSPARQDPQALRAIAQQEAQSGSTPEAIAHYTEALESFHANGNVNDELEALEALAALSLQHEDYAEVLAYIDRGTALAQQVNNPQREAHLLVLLGDLQSALGRNEGAEAAYKEAINAYRATESWVEIAQALDKLATLYLEQDRLSDAAVVLEQTIPIFERMDRKEELQVALDRLGDVQADLMHWDEALSHHVRALQFALETNNDQRAFEQLVDLGSISEESGDREGALPYYQQALHLAFKSGNTTSQGEIMLALGRLLIDDTVQLHRVVQLLEGAVERLPDNVDAKRLLGRAKAREERLVNAGVTLLLVENGIEDYARDAAGVSSTDER